MSRTYKSHDHAARAFVAAGKKDGTVTVIGGGWWHVKNFGNVQGLTALARRLAFAGLLTVNADRTATLKKKK